MHRTPMPAPPRHAPPHPDPPAPARPYSNARPPPPARPPGHGPVFEVGIRRRASRPSLPPP